MNELAAGGFRAAPAVCGGQGAARQGWVRLGTAWRLRRGMVRSGEAWRLRRGVARLGLARRLRWRLSGIGEQRFSLAVGARFGTVVRVMAWRFRNGTVARV